MNIENIFFLIIFFARLFSLLFPPPQENMLSSQQSCEASTLRGHNQHTHKVTSQIDWGHDYRT